MDIKQEVVNIANELNANYNEQKFFDVTKGDRIPSREGIIELIDELCRVSFPGFFGRENLAYVSKEHFAGNEIAVIYEKLKRQVKIAIAYDRDIKNMDSIDAEAENIALRFIKCIPKVQALLIKDVTAEFDGDPAAKSKAEIVLSYPGMYAILVYRYAHELYQMEVPYIPRIMTEHAHSKTGIDINPGATIGEYFCIDHGTGIVIGETTTIGNHVKIYQGVTLGALSTMKGQALSGIKRHPTIEDNVVIYANTTILGGETVVGENSVVAGNTFVTESIPANTKVTTLQPQLELFTREKRG